MKKSLKNILRVLLVSSIAVLFAACGQAVTPEPTQDPSVLQTEMVQTIVANITETAAAMPTNTPEPTSTPLIITATAAPVVSLPTAESLPMITNPGVVQDPVLAPTEAIVSIGEEPTQIPPTATLPTGGDKASYDSQSPVDGTHVSRGANFDISWYLLNSGTTTWTSDYSVRYFSGTNFCKPGKNRYYLNSVVAPNTVGQLSIDAIAPSSSGTYTMAVVLGNEMDENFYVMDITIVVD